MTEKFEGSYLKRLPSEYYQGQAMVHWSLTIQDRKKGWLRPIMLYKFRELLTHSMFRYGLCCPIFVLMPDHFHMIWMGIFNESNQLPAMKHFRNRFNGILKAFDCELQEQSFENVLKDDQRQEQDFAKVCEYIARNPERAQLISVDSFVHYKYSGCLLPGYPELKPFTPDYWTRFWRSYSFLRTNGLIRFA